MDLEVRYRGKVATSQDVEFINRLILENPDDSRRALSQKICRAWNWVQPNGALRDMVCRGFMLRLESAGYIKLPPARCKSNNTGTGRKRPPKVATDKTPVITALSKLKPLDIRQVRRTPSERLFNSLIDEHHYLGYCHPVGEQLKYVIFTGETPVACLAWSSAPRHIGCRDRFTPLEITETTAVMHCAFNNRPLSLTGFIGWPADIRRKNIHLVAYNSRFLILPWVRIPCLASHILGLMARVIQSDWNRAYNHPVYFLETFVDTERFKGTCYYAANWIYLGDTTGRGKDDQTNKPNRSIKAVLGYPLSRNFRELLQNG